MFVVSDHGHTVRCSRRDLRNTLSKYWEAKRGHFDDPRVFLGTSRDDDTKGDKPKYVLDLSRPVVGLVTALEAGTQNVQDSIYHPASGKCIEVLSQADVAYVKADVAGCRDFDLATKFALLNSQRLALPRDVYAQAACLVEAIQSADLSDLTDEFIGRLMEFQKWAVKAKVNSYAGLIGVSIAHAKYRQEQEAPQATDRRNEAQFVMFV